MMGRIAWIGALAVMGLVIGAAQIDRASRYAPQLAPLVPTPFRSFSLVHLAQDAMVHGQSEEALRLSRQLVRARPLPAEHLTLLSQAELRAGMSDAGLAALEEAGRRGWREPYSQAAMARAALLAGNPDAAAQRLAALLATGAAGADVTEPILAELAATPQGRAALARQLAQPGYWQAGVLARPRLFPSGGYEEMLRLAANEEGGLACPLRDSAVSALRRARDYEGAARLAELNCQRG
ncbi:hypothetical protein [Alteraurantiacibacter palmitatis]|uniref:Tetratricopeptide repeat protein n=1 Tax=Alteraurantiacibacter palmitatis TaxID=2054628 RepID=A0ABV7E8A1_9SPHN